MSSASQIYAEFGKYKTGEPFAVNNVERGGSLRLRRHEDGTLSPQTEKSDPTGYHALYVSSSPSEASFAARDKMREVITAAVAEHLRRNPEMVAAAAARALAEDIERAEKVVNELRANLAAAETELAKLKGGR
jgi:hypothetical protein